MSIIYHLIAILGICLIYEGILPLFFTETWQTRMKYWANTTSNNVIKFALKLVGLGSCLLILSAIIYKVSL